METVSLEALKKQFFGGLLHEMRLLILNAVWCDGPDEPSRQLHLFEFIF